MTPNFALSLSFEGIRLLHRVTGGWHLVGEVSLDAEDMAAELAVLKAAAQTLEPGGMQTKLVIPDAQIKYTTIETARTTLDDVHAALDGATPYAIDELVIDFDRNGGRTHIAAVARETLDEAESFANEHGLNPVCFAAVAEPFTFQGEVFFGAVKGLDPKARPTRDAAPVKVIGAARLPEPEPVNDSTPVAEEPADAAAETEEMPAFRAKPRDAAPAAEVARDAPAEPDEVPTFKAKPRVKVALDAGPVVAPQEAETDVDVIFASRSRAVSMPPQAMPDTVEAATPEPQIEPLFTRRKEPPSLAVPVTATTGPAVASPVLDLPGTPPKPLSADAPEVAEAPPLTGKPAQGATTDSSFAPVHAVPAAKEPAPLTAPPRKAKEKAAKPVKTTALDRAAPGRQKPRFLALKLTAGLLVVLFLVALWANTLSDDGLAWLWGGDETPVEVVAAPETPATDPEETAVVTLQAPAPAETPAPSALAPVDDAPVETAEAAPLPVVRATGRVLSPAEADRIYAATGVYQRAPRLTDVPREATLDGFRESAIVIAGDRPAQLSLPATDALFQDLPLSPPRNPPPAGTVYQRDLRGFILATADGVLTPDGALVFAGEPLRVPPLRPGTEIIAAPDPSPVAANGEGIILVAGRPPLVPPLRPEGLVPEEALAPETAPDAPETEFAATPTDPEALTTDETLVEATPAAPETPLETAPVEEGLVLVSGRPARVPPPRPEGLVPEEALALEATPEVPATAPEGLVVVAGSPPRKPPLRPAAFADLAPTDEAAIESVVTEVVSTAGGVSLAGLRPSVRPDSVLAAIPAPVFADPQLAGFRPSLRPADLAPAPAPQAQEPDLTDIVAAIAEAAPPSAFVSVTPRAVPVSARPDLRPRNFARVVAAAQQRAQQQPQQQQTASAPAQQVRSAPAQPTGPTATSVARAATTANAIRLRDVNLIGVYGRPGDRRALVRMGNGRMIKVAVGSALDGGRVTAIGDSALNYVKRGKTYALQLPQG